MEHKIAPDDLVDALAAQGMSDSEIVRYLDEHHDITVSVVAVSAWRERHGDRIRRAPASEESAPPPQE